MNTRWPWIVPLVTLLLALSPPGWAIIRAALSSERLSQNIALPLAVMALGVACALTLIEWGIRSLILRNRARRTGE